MWKSIKEVSYLPFSCWVSQSLDRQIREFNANKYTYIMEIKFIDKIGFNNQN